MDHSWRPRLPTDNICPFCSNSHFPFCPVPPLPRYFPPPPPPPPLPHPDQFFQRQLPPQPPLPPLPPLSPPQPYHPFADPYPPPPPAQIPQRSSNASPNFSRDFGVNPGLKFSDNNQTKRMRLHYSPSTAAAAAEDERRLKLIRDHGAVSNGLVMIADGGSNFFPNNTLEPSKYGDRFLQNEGGFNLENNAQLKRKFEERQPVHQHRVNNKSTDFGQTLCSKQNNNLMRNHVYGNNISGHRGDNFERACGNHEAHVYVHKSFQEQRRNFHVETLSRQHIMEPKTQDLNSGPKGSFNGQPPLPNSPPPPLPVELPGFQFAGRIASSSASGPSSLFPVAVDAVSSMQSPYTASQANTSESMHYSRKTYPDSISYPEESQAVKSSNKHLGGKEGFIMRHPSLDKPKVIDGSLILKHPHRSSRPDHIVIILRGLPGSGKSYLAKLLRDLEVENGGNAPRIHSMDDYFMTEVEKVEESEGSGSSRGKKPVIKKLMEYCYEPEMEEAYRSSMLRAFKKTLDEGIFSFVIVDDRNLRVADFAQFWATAKRSGYEVYLLEATYTDPAGCAARNVHGFSLTDIQKMANQWEETPSLYMMLDIKSLLHGDNLEENGIQEVDMDAEDNHIDGFSGSEDTYFGEVIKPSEGPSNSEHKWNAVEQCPVEVVKELGKSKWSTDLDEDNFQKTGMTVRKSSALSGLVKSYGKQGKSVRWADQVGRIGFSISAGKATNISLVIGPGSGYSLKSNPMPDEEKLIQTSGEPRRQNVFQQQLRAEHESFRAVFDKRRQRIRGLDAEHE